MLKSILAIAVILAAGIAAVLIYATTKPDSFSYERSALIPASPEKVYPLINDLHGFNTWNPYERKDPNMKGHYTGPAAGVGAQYHFDGNKDVGVGRLEIIDTQPNASVTMKLVMMEPMAVDNTVRFTLSPEGSGTRVIWSMNGGAPYLAKVASVFFDMDKMVGKDFEDGLENLKSLPSIH